MSLFDKLLHPDAEPDEPRLTLERSMEALRLQTSAHDAAWGIGGSRWEVDLDEGQIRFHTPKGMLATAPVQVVGTYNSEDGTFLWGWDHPSIPAARAEYARLAREFGERYGLSDYTTRKIECGEDKAWEFAAVACYLAKAQGAYRGPSGPTGVFMTFGDVRLTQDL